MESIGWLVGPLLIVLAMLAPFMIIYSITQRGAAPGRPRVFIPGVIFAALAVWWIWPGGFSDAQIDSVKNQIRAEFDKKAGVSVEDVSLVRESANKLTGFVRLKIAGLDADITKECAVTRDDEQVIWQCR